MDHYNARKKQMSIMLFCNTYIPNNITHTTKKITHTTNNITHTTKKITHTTNETRTQRKN